MRQSSVLILWTGPNTTATTAANKRWTLLLLPLAVWPRVEKLQLLAEGGRRRPAHAFAAVLLHAHHPPAHREYLLPGEKQRHFRDQFSVIGKVGLARGPSISAAAMIAWWWFLLLACRAPARPGEEEREGREKERKGEAQYRIFAKRYITLLLCSRSCSNGNPTATTTSFCSSMCDSFLTFDI